MRLLFALRGTGGLQKSGVEEQKRYVKPTGDQIAGATKNSSAARFGFPDGTGNTNRPLAKRQDPGALKDRQQTSRSAC